MDLGYVLKGNERIADGFNVGDEKEKQVDFQVLILIL